MVREGEGYCWVGGPHACRDGALRGEAERLRFGKDLRPWRAERGGDQEVPTTPPSPHFKGYPPRAPQLSSRATWVSAEEPLCQGGAPQGPECWEEPKRLS